MPLPAKYGGGFRGWGVPCLPQNLDSTKSGIYCTRGHFIASLWAEHLLLDKCPKCDESLLGTVLLVNDTSQHWG